ncbi:MAG: DUF2797 domain-containing protein [Flavobacteriaceae bacterium]
MQFQGVLKKMLTENGTPINYYLDLEDDFINLNQLIDKKISINFLKYQCLNCGKDKKIYRQGYCYDCFFDMPQTGDWIMHPELSTAHLDKEDRDLEYEKEVQLKPHIVYLANSSNVKVGVTRKSQIPTRWIDQGAHEALVFVEVPNRYLAGITEVALKDQISDKTNWRKMLTNNITDVDLKAQKEQLSKYIPEEVKPYFGLETNAVHLNFPVIKYPVKVKSLSLDKTSLFTGILKGIKGQYLIFEDGTVFNVRSYEGYVVKFDLN